VSTAVITLNKGRRPHLTRLLEGLARGTVPDTCIVVEIGDDEAPFPPLPFQVTRVPFPQAGLPLAAARNAGRRAAQADTLIFLDVDCIPTAGLVAGLSRAVAEHDGLVCCEIGYLPAGAVADGWDAAGLDWLGQPHPVRAFPPAGATRPVLVPGLRGPRHDV
jgi:hypothetical protein